MGIEFTGEDICRWGGGVVGEEFPGSGWIWKRAGSGRKTVAGAGGARVRGVGGVGGFRGFGVRPPLAPPAAALFVPDWQRRLDW